MKEIIQHIKFNNKTNPKSFFEVVRVEELLARKLDHDIFSSHIANFYIIFFVVGGEGYHTIDFVDYKYRKGTVLLIRRDQIQNFFRSTNVKGYLLIFTEEFIVSHLNQLEALKSLQLFNELLSFPKIELKIEEEEYSNFTTIVKQIEWEYTFKDEYSIGITRSASFQEMVEQNCFTNKKVKDYALKIGCSTKTLNNIAQEVVNKSAKVFIDEIAIMQIKRLLISTNQSIKEIAYTAGFDDPTNFFKYFKKYVGSSPEVFRQAYQ